ncbi:MAG TPA: Gldg family protein [Xanthomonadaceae bacterium]|nr:Gldg family protein [Xanthomonadaceae bacterium]
MSKRLPLSIALPLLTVVFVVLVFLSGLLLRGARLDLTANRLYTLSPGTAHILASNREPIHLQLFVSDQAMRDLPGLRAYAQRVRELIEEIAAKSHGTITLEVIDPKPYSDAEDKAAGAGLQAVPAGVNGSPIYFGLVGTNSRRTQSIDPFFDPAKEVFLEYDIAKLIVSLSSEHKPVVAMLSSLHSGPSFDPSTGQIHDGWAIDSELAKAYELRRLQPNPTSIGSDVDLLILIHPKNLSDDTQYAIDQFVLRGGRLLVFVDPFAEADPGAQNPPQLAAGGVLTPSVSSVPERLFKAWGIVFDPRKIVRDAENALDIQDDPRVQPVSNPVLIGLTKDALNQDDIVSAQLDSLNFSTAGALELAPHSPMTMEPLARSSTNADLIDTDRARMQADPKQLAEGFHATGKSYVLAARLTGKPTSAFPERKDAKRLASAREPVSIIVVADTDVLTDRLWVHSQDFFGRHLLNPFAKNGDFVTNAVDNLVGTPDLIALRTRSAFNRPFTRVERLRQRADQSLRGKQDELQTQLKAMEAKLAELQPGKPGQGAQQLTAQQSAEIRDFQQQRQRVRGELRDVQQQLNASIDRLGSRLKLIDILGVPLLLTLASLVVAWWRRRPQRDAA